MVNPSELLRTNSAFNDDDDNNGDEGGFVAPIEDYRNIVDCGCTALLPCLNEKFNLERFAKPKFFLIVLSIIGVFSGIVLKYFRGTSQIWSLHYQIEQDTIDWLIYINEVFVGFFALIIAYWGNRMHRPKWLGAITIYLAVSCLFLAILEFFQPVKENETDIDVINGHTLCQRTKNMNKSMGNLNLSENSNFNNNDQYVVPFVLILLYQFTFALFFITFLTHGISYIDDSLSSSYAPISIALIFTFNRMGMQSGIFAAWMPYMFSRKSIFFSILWLFVASLLLVTGCIIAMFPKNMPNILLKKSVNSLLNIASGGNNASSSSVIELNQKNVEGFFISILRLLKNKILLLVILTETLMQSAIINFQIKEKHINQEKYHIPKFNDNSGYSDPTLIQFTNTVLKQPLIGISYIAVGLVLAKIQPKPKLILIWNLKAYLAVLVSFVLTRFFSCTNSKIQNNGKFEIFSYCSWNCGCSLDGPFQPVCLNTKTYFSPCAAGCTEFNSALRIYRNCSCGFPHNNNNNNNITDAAEAANGSCDADSCNTLWVFVQVHAVFSAALLASTFINSLFIILRCVARKDKALALGLYLSFVSLLPYLPIRLIYNAITDNFCQIFGTKTCQIYSAQFSLYTSIITICIKFLAIISCIGLSFIIGDLELYKISSNNSNKGGSQQENLNEENLYIGTSSPSTVGEEVPNAENTNLIHQTDGLRNNNKQQSESDLNTLEGGSMKNERINTYLSEGALVPPLKNKMLTSTKSGSKNSNSNKSVLTSSSLSAIADEIGDDHDSDVSSFQRPQKVKLLEEKLRHDPSSPSSSVNNKEKIEETQF